MTKEEFEILTDDKIQSLIEANLYEDSAKFALNHRNNELPTLLVSSQLKYLQKSRKKIPTFYESRCIIPQIAYEQASSEQSAAMKSFAGARCLDLSCGLGVDVAHFSRHFDRVDAVDIDAVKIEIACYNFQKMGIYNVEFFHNSAEKYLSTLNGPKYDLIYLDPARRDLRGNRTYAPEDCQPNIFSLLPDLFKHGKRVLVKLSPLYDLAEAVRQFPQMSAFHIYSVDNECKEVLLELEPNKSAEEKPKVLIKCFRSGTLSTYEFELGKTGAIEQKELTSKYILDADVAFYKGRLVEQLFAKYFPDASGALPFSQGFFYMENEPPPDFPGRAFQVLGVFPYKPKALKRTFKEEGISRMEIIQRNFPFSVKDIRKQLQLKAGGKHFLLASMWQGKKHVFLCQKW